MSVREADIEARNRPMVELELLGKDVGSQWPKKQNVIKRTSVVKIHVRLRIRIPSFRL